MTKRVAPVVRTRAKQDGIDVNQIPGSGKNGAVTVADYETFVGKKLPPPPPAAVAVSQQRPTMNHMTDDENKVIVDGVEFSRSISSFDSSFRKVLDIPEECKNNELHYRWVNDDRGKIQHAQKMGYKIVEKMIDPATGKQIDTARRVGTKQDGSDLNAYIMATPKQWKEERNAALEKERRVKEEGVINSPQDEHGNSLTSSGEFYKKKSKLSRE